MSKLKLCCLKVTVLCSNVQCCNILRAHRDGHMLSQLLTHLCGMFSGHPCTFMCRGCVGKIYTPDAGHHNEHSFPTQDLLKLLAHCTVCVLKSSHMDSAFKFEASKGMASCSTSQLQVRHPQICIPFSDSLVQLHQLYYVHT